MSQRHRLRNVFDPRNAALIDTLEPRRMLATFTGSNSAGDAFEIFIAPASVEVVRNGVSMGTTTDLNVIVDGLGGGVGIVDDTFVIRETGSGTRTQRLNLTIRGTDADTVTSFGTATSPIDLDTINTNFFVDQGFRATVNIYDQDDDTSVEPFIAYLSTSTRQVVAKGTFEISWNETDFANHDFFGGTSDDVFSFAGSLSNSSIDFDGGPGDDLVQTINFNNNNRDNDIDDAIPSGFRFVGGDGIDFYDLDDSGDQTGDGDLGYSIGNGFISKVGRSWHHEQVERVSLVGDSDNNTIRFARSAAAPSDALVTANGGLGNDTFSNFSSTEDQILDFKIGGLFGGPGTDTIELFDVDNPDFRVYRFESDVFNFDGIDVEYDSSTELFLLEQNDAGSTNRLLGKPAGMAMNINALGGSDLFREVGGGDLDSSGLLQGGVTVSGGAGTDSIEFDDRLDMTVAGEDESYTFATFTLAKGGLPFNYNAFESQKLIVADTNGPSGNSVPTVNLNAISGQLTSTTIDGGAVRTCTVNLANGNLAALAGTIALLLEGGAINFNDQNATAARTYDLGATGMTSPQPVTYSGATSLTLNGGPLNDSFFIRGSTAPATINGGIGNDTVTVGSGFANYAAPVTVNGQVGTDILRFNGASETDLFVGTLRSNSFASSGITHPYTAFESVFVQTGSSGSDLTIHSVVTLTPPDISSTTFAGGSGDDLIRFGVGNIVGTLTGNVSISGGGGSDTLIIDDSTSTSARDYTFDQGNRFYRGTITQATVVRTSIERTILEATSARNVITVDGSSSPLTIRANNGNDSVNVLDATSPVTVNTGPENLSASFGDAILVNTDFAVAGDVAATVIVDEVDAVQELNVAQNGTLRIMSTGVLEKNSGTTSALAIFGTIDLAGGALLSRVGGPAPSFFRPHLIRGHNAGAWNGTSSSGAINSSLAAGSAISDGVGYGLGAETAVTSLGDLSIAAGDTLLRYTLDGDTDLNGVTDISDFARIAANFNGTGKVWTTGDSNYDNVTNIADFSPLAANFNQATTATSRRAPLALPPFSRRLIDLRPEERAME